MDEASERLLAADLYTNLQAHGYRDDPDTPLVDAMPLMMLTITALNAAGVLTLGDLCNCSAKQLRATAGLGRKSLYDVIRGVAAHGMTLRKDCRPTR